MPSTTEEPSVLRTVTDLLAVVERLPAPERAAAVARIDAALAGDARSCRAALGLLALDLTPSTVPTDGRDLSVRVHVLDLDRVPVRATA